MEPIKNLNDKAPHKNDNTPFFQVKATMDEIKFLPFYGKITYHVCAFLIYTLLEIMVIYINGEPIAARYYIPYYTLFIFLFYFYAHKVYPTGYYIWNKNKVWSMMVFGGTMLLTTIMLIAFNHISRYHLTGELSLRTHHKTLTNSIWRSFMLFNLSAMYWLFVHTIFKKKEEINIIKRQNDLERQAFESQLAYEHARINPHFLFNNLQYVYRIVEPISAKAEVVISNLVDMMRLLLAELPSDHKITLERELYTVELFFTMSQQLRENNCYFTFTRPAAEQTEALCIPPQIILTLAENLFKHGLMNDPEHPAELKVAVESNTLSIKLTNRKYTDNKMSEGGIGMQNLKSRLNYFYPNNYTLDIRETNENFELNLIVPL
ncbi:MAG: hypothetical protein BGO31_07530 [Bacteroidetes bacterium 43-16]|nr:MAG: hypothetical protein BGO31_07530 [Bacteroidetes bacterium 43-16]